MHKKLLLHTLNKNATETIWVFFIQFSEKQKKANVSYCSLRSGRSVVKTKIELP